MEGNLRQIILWLVAVAVIVVVILGVRLAILRSAELAGSPLNPTLATSAPFGNPPKQWGVFANAFQINDLDDPFSPAKIDATIAVLKDLGVNAVLLPYEALPTGEPNDAVNDVMVDKFSKAGLSIVMLCCDGFEFGETNRYQAAYEFAQRLGQKYGNQIHYFQFLNEISGTAIKPGHSGFTFDDYEPEKYVKIRELLRGLTDGLASASPRAQRILSAHWLGIGIIDQLINDRVSFEIVAWHWFSDMGPDPVAIPLATERGVPAEFDGQIFNLPAHFTKQGKRFWVTETNLTNGSLNGLERQQADYLRHMLEVVKATDNISGFFYYRLTDGAENAGKSAWGLYETSKTADGSTLNYDHPKEAYQVYKDFLKIEHQARPVPFDLQPTNR